MHDVRIDGIGSPPPAGTELDKNEGEGEAQPKPLRGGGPTPERVGPENQISSGRPVFRFSSKKSTSSSAAIRNRNLSGCTRRHNCLSRVVFVDLVSGVFGWFDHVAG